MATDSCTPLPNGINSATAQPSNWSTCKPWDLTQDVAVNSFINSTIEESIQIAGAPIVVHKLLGVHEQTKLIDLTGQGQPISNGAQTNYPAGNAFTILKTEWRSQQSGAAVTTSAYIGYDFGYLKTLSGQPMYGDVSANLRYQISTIKIKQSANANNRATKARVERSDDGTNWYGVAIVTLPDDSNLNQVSFKHSVPQRYWRLRPVAFNGGSCDYWGVQALEMSDWDPTAQNNIEDKILMENRDRDYSGAPITIKGYYDIPTVNSDLTKFGIEIPTGNYTIKIPFNACVAQIGRPMVIGDILQLPSETQYAPDLTPIKRYLEVTDVTWDPSSYTPGWLPTILLVTASQAFASQETQDIFGDLAAITDTSGLFNNDDGNNRMYQDNSTVTQTIVADAATAVPERGSEGSRTIRDFTSEEKAQAAAVGINVAKISLNPTGLYVEDAIPGNDAPYGEGNVLPPSGKDKEYFRLTYTGTAADTPARLYRWSANKNRWIWLETDRRAQYNMQNQILDEYLISPNKRSTKNIR